MSYKKAFLQLPLNAQIYISLIIMIIITILLIIIMSEVITSVFIDYLTLTKKEYFYDMYQNILESNLFFMNLCLLQYEHLIKLFNYQFYLYLKDEDILMDFTFMNYNLSNNNNINDNNKLLILYKSNIENLLKNDNSLDEGKKLYVFCYSNDNLFIGILTPLIMANYLSFFNQIKGVGNFRIPFYGDVITLEKYVLFFTKYKAFISLDIHPFFNYYQLYDGNIDYFVDDFIIARRKTNYIYYKKYFEDYENNKLFFIDIMFNLKADIFYNYTKIEDENSKEEYIKNQSIYFQNIDYANGSTWFFDTWDTNDPRYQGTNKIINSYIDFLLFHLSSKIDAFSIPFMHETNEIISKNLCYYFLLKQIVNLAIASDEIYTEFDSNFADQMYDKLINKENITINDCKLETYYSKNLGQTINISNNFYDYYNLEYKYDTYIYLLRENYINSIIFEMKYSYPNCLSLKDIFPNFFSFNQIDLYSFSFGNEIARIANSSKEFYMNIRYLMILCLYLNWIIFIIIVIFISSRTIQQITEPIIRLTEIIDLDNLNEKNVNENIFEYKSDDDINEFFLLCKKLINGEIQEYNYKKKENSDINNNINNNMIINNKMILELIENQKSLNNDDKEIFLLRKENTVNIRTRKHKTNSSSNKVYNNKEKNSQGLELFKLTSVANNDNDNNKLINSSQDLYSNIDENESELNNMKSYENLLNLADYIYNWKDIERKNDRSKLRININHTSTTNKNFLKLGSVNNISVKDKSENENIKRDYKYITNYWYINAKKNKIFDNN